MKKTVLFLPLIFFLLSFFSCHSAEKEGLSFPKDSIRQDKLKEADHIFYGKEFTSSEDTTYNFRTTAGHFLTYQTSYHNEINERSKKEYIYALSPDGKTIYIQLIKQSFPTDYIIGSKEEPEDKTIYSLLTFAEYASFLDSTQYATCTKAQLAALIKADNTQKMQFIINLGLKGNASDKEVIEEVLKNVSKVEHEELSIVKKAFARVSSFDISIKAGSPSSYSRLDEYNITIKEKFNPVLLTTFNFFKTFTYSSPIYEVEEEGKEESSRQSFNIKIEGNKCEGMLLKIKDGLISTYYSLVGTTAKSLLFINYFNFNDKLEANYTVEGDRIQVQFLESNDKVIKGKNIDPFYLDIRLGESKDYTIKLKEVTD